MGKDILGVSVQEVLICAMITGVLTAIFFLPAITDFGKTLYGTEDIQFFIWLFWHYGNALSQGTNPFVASEVFYPVGVTLSATTITPLTAAAYLIMPDAWGPFGRITAIQVLSFILGGVFSFILARRFVKSFLPAMLGSIVFNFSAFHFEKALHHINYSMAMPFLALFFIFYLAAMDEKKEKRRILGLSTSLVLLALCEFMVAVMAGFIIFIDIFRRYAKNSHADLLTPRNMLIMGLASALSLVAFDLLAVAGASSLIVHTVPSSFFIAVCLFGVLGSKNLLFREEEDGYLRSIALSASPLFLYLAAIALLQPYQIVNEQLTQNVVAYAIPIGYLIIPSGFQAIWHAVGGLPGLSETGVYVGLPVLALIACSWLVRGATPQEERLRWLFLISIAISFPLIVFGNAAITATPFMVSQLFPLLGLLRSQSRFMMFTFVFLAPLTAIIAGRLAERLGDRKRLFLLALCALLLFERWPSLGDFVFQPGIPGFYKDIARDGSVDAIFLYPSQDYFGYLREVYFQTLHGKNISFGVMSRFPASGSERLFDIYWMVDSDIAGFVKETGYDYVVLPKVDCGRKQYGCFHMILQPANQSVLKEKMDHLEKEFGAPAYEDEMLAAYEVG
ncbi:MAG: hypothetical protein V1827_02330 [Candidatus Micrarchaeota archaeon]